VRSARRAIAPALLLLALIGLWELYVDLRGVDTLILPAPHAIAAALYTDRSALWSNFLVTAQEIVFGIGVGVAAALAMAVLIHFSQIARRAVYPLLIASQAVPIPILAPVLVLWLGFGIEPKVVVIALVSFFPIVVTTLAALATVDPSLLKLMRTFDASRLRTFRHVEMPSALPGVVTGAKLAAVFSVIGAVLGEEAGASHGLGYLLTIASNNYEMPEAFAAVAILSAFAVALFLALSLFERRALPWAYRPTGDAP
jgi:NitT/TauT family transport system permease protein/putative hydroxymethylpyrimidine transport system permease protein